LFDLAAAKSQPSRAPQQRPGWRRPSIYPAVPALIYASDPAGAARAITSRGLLASYHRTDDAAAAAADDDDVMTR